MSTDGGASPTSDVEGIGVTVSANIEKYLADIDRAGGAIAGLARDLENQSKRVAKLTEAMLTPTERFAKEVQELGEINRVTAGFQETYNRAIHVAASQLPEYIEWQAERNRVERLGTAIVEASIEPEERHAALLKDMALLLNEKRINQEQYNAAAEASLRTIPQVADFDRQQAAAKKELGQVLAANTTAEEQYQAGLARLTQQMQIAGLTEKQRNVVLSDYHQSLPEAIALQSQYNALREEAAAIMRAGMTDMERFEAQNKRLLELEKEGVLDKKALAEAQSNLAQSLPEVSQHLQRANALQQEADRITRSQYTAVERLDAALQHLDEVRANSNMSIATYNRALADEYHGLAEVQTYLQRVNALHAEANANTQAGLPWEQQYLQALARENELLENNAEYQQTYNRRIADLLQMSPEAIALQQQYNAAREKEAKVMAALVSPVDEHVQRIKDIKDLYKSGNLTSQARYDLLLKETGLLPELIDRQVAFANAKRGLLGVDLSSISASERLRLRLEAIEELHERGAISAKAKLILTRQVTQAHDAEIHALQEKANAERTASIAAADHRREHEKFADAAFAVTAAMQTGNLAISQQQAAIAQLRTQYNALVPSLRQVGAVITHTGNRLRTVGRNMSLYVTAPLLGFGALATREFAMFDEAMQKSLSIMDGVGPNTVPQLEAAAFTVGKNSNIPINKIAEAYEHLASAGYVANDAMRLLPITERFAVAGAFDLEKATMMLAQSQSALGLRTKDTEQNMKNMTRVADVLTRANAISTGTVESFAKALTTKSAGAMRLLNMEAEEGVAILAAFAEQGINGEHSGEAFSMVLRDMQTAVLRNSDAWKAHSLSIYDSNKNMRPMVEIIEQLEKKMESLSDLEKKHLLMQLGFQDRSVAYTQQLLGMSQVIREFQAELENAGGTIDKVAEDKLKSFSARLAQFRNRVTIAGFEIADRLLPHLTRLMESIERGLVWWDSLDRSTQSLILKTLAITAALGPFTNGIGLITASVGTLLSLYAGWNRILPLIKGHILAVHLGLTKQATATNVVTSANLGMMMSQGQATVATVTSTRAITVWGHVAQAAIAKARAFRLALGGLAGGGLLLLGSALLDAAANTDALNAANEKSLDLNEKLLAVEEERAKLTLKEAAGIEEPAARKKFLEEELARLKKDQFDRGEQYNTAKRAVDAFMPTAAEDSFLGDVWATVTTVANGTLMLTGLVENLEEKEKAAAKASLQAAMERLNLSKASVKAVEDELEAMNKPGRTDANGNPLTADEIVNQPRVDEMIKKYEMQAEAARLSSYETKYLEMVTEGFSNAQAEAVAIAHEWAEIQKASAKFDAERVASIAKVTQSLQEQIDTFWMDNKARTLFAHKSRFGDGGLDEIRRLQDQLSVLEDEKALRDRAEAIKKKYEDPTEKFNKTKADLDRMLGTVVDGNQLITQEEYSKALEEARKEMQREINVDVKVNVLGFDAVEAGTLESMKRLEEFRRRLLIPDDEAPAIAGGKKEKSKDKIPLFNNVGVGAGFYDQQAYSPWEHSVDPGEYMTRPRGWIGGMIEDDEGHFAGDYVPDAGAYAGPAVDEWFLNQQRMLWGLGAGGRAPDITEQSPISRVTRKQMRQPKGFATMLDEMKQPTLTQAAPISLGAVVQGSGVASSTDVVQQRRQERSFDAMEALLAQIAENTGKSKTPSDVVMVPLNLRGT